MSLLLLEDEWNLGSTLFEKLSQEGYSVIWERKIMEAQKKVLPQTIELALLDLKLPDGSGLDFARWLKTHSKNTAFLFLSAIHEPEERVQAFELGALDYIPKPFHWRELSLRIQKSLAQLKKIHQQFSLPSLQIGLAQIDFEAFSIQSPRGTRTLSHKEMALLKLFLSKPGKVWSRDAILDEVWSLHEFPTPRTVDNFILRLRRLLEVDPENPRIIQSIRGVGYVLNREEGHSLPIPPIGVHS